jgi:hypothetical protein
MPYPHVMQLERFDCRRRRTVGVADVQSHGAVVPAAARRGLARLRRLRRTSRRASSVI